MSNDNPHQGYIVWIPAIRPVGATPSFYPCLVDTEAEIADVLSANHDGNIKECIVTKELSWKLVVQ